MFSSCDNFLIFIDNLNTLPPNPNVSIYYFEHVIIYSSCRLTYECVLAVVNKYRIS